MARAIWSGSISFGLVNVPVKLVTAVQDKDLHFHMLHEADGSRIRFKKFCAKEEREVDAAEIVKGYEVSHGQYVTFTSQELEAADPVGSRTIEIQDFVDAAGIDPAFYDRPYYLIPDKNADKAYGLLTAALQKSAKVGIARMVMREKEYLVALRARDGVLMMETMHFADEVVPPSSVAGEIAAGEADKRQLELAQRLIDSLTTEFDPQKYRDRHRERVLELVEQKAAGKEVVIEAAPRTVAKTTDLLAALERSLQHVQSRGGTQMLQHKGDGEAPKDKASAGKHPKKAAARKRSPRPKRAAKEPKEP